MSKDSETPPPPGGQFLVYQTEDGKLKIDVRFQGETVWLTQQHMAELFQTTKQNNEGCSGGDDRSPPTAPFG